MMASMLLVTQRECLVASMNLSHRKKYKKNRITKYTANRIVSILPRELKLYNIDSFNLLYRAR